MSPKGERAIVAQPRRFPRATMRSVAQIVSGRHRFNAEVRMLSRGGALVSGLPEELEPGTSVHAWIMLPKSQRPAGAFAKILYREGPCVGLGFTAIAPEEEDRIARVVDRMGLVWLGLHFCLGMTTTNPDQVAALCNELGLDPGLPRTRLRAAVQLAIERLQVHPHAAA